MTQYQERLQEAANARQMGNTNALHLTDVQGLLTDGFLQAYSDFKNVAEFKAEIEGAGLLPETLMTVEEWNQSRVCQIVAARSAFVSFGKMFAAAAIWVEEDGHWTDGEDGSAHIWEGSGRRH